MSALDVAAPGQAAHRTRAPGQASVIGLQRSAGNASTSALVRRAREAPMTLSLPGMADHIAVSAWSLEGPREHPSLSITRVADSDSPRLMQALERGEPEATATLVVAKLTPLGWVRQLTLTMDHCVVSSYSAQGDYESIDLGCTRVHFG
jgi:Type VI secretion system effector, Hcp